VLIASAVATLVGKALAVRSLEGVRSPLLLLGWAFSADLAMYCGAAALLAMLEMRARRAWLVTFPLALGGAITATLNTGYLIITGEQGSWEAFVQLFARIGDVVDITGEGVDREVGLVIAGGAAAGIALPLLLRWLMRRRRLSFERGVHGHARAVCAAWLAIAGLVVVMAAPRPRTAMARNLGKTALLSIARTLVMSLDRGSFAGYKPSRLASSAIISRFADGAEHPNVVVVVLESTRFDRTSLSDHPEAADTPTLEQLAEEGLSAPRARAVLPHTTKSLFSILCGRYPLMQKKVAEVSADLKVQCLPSILAEAGYETAFFQSSWGTFEWRPRLVQRLGFGLFRAWEDIRGQELGYLASDDESLAAPFGKWLDEIRASKQPFMATLLTSAPHHPYRLSRRAEKAAHEGGLPIETDEQRYLRLLEAEDRLLEALLKALERRRLRDKTIVVVVGDHGEGFGEKGVKQHDNNFYEEGLRVPLVIVGPGVPQREVEGNATLLDVTPTLLALLGIELDAKGAAALDGHNLLAEDFPGDLPRYFSCWFEMRCRGFVVGETKVVYEPQADEAWYYDLANDPGEANPLALTKALEAELLRLQDRLQRARARKYSVVFGDTYIGPWRCAAGESECRHPNAKKERYRYERAPEAAPSAAVVDDGIVRPKLPRLTPKTDPQGEGASAGGRRIDRRGRKSEADPGAALAGEAGAKAATPAAAGSEG
jgi:lipoteichoic acid synthase